MLPGRSIILLGPGALALLVLVTTCAAAREEQVLPSDLFGRGRVATARVTLLNMATPAASSIASHFWVTTVVQAGDTGCRVFVLQMGKVRE
jgi:hypothetical protein